MMKSTLGLLLLLSTLPALGAVGDLSKYREFRFGADLPAIAKQSGADPAQVKAIHSRPVLIQELDWRPRPIGPQREAVEDVVFSFYNGGLYRIAVRYDRYETEGLTADDLIESISATYGPAVRPPTPQKTAEQVSYGDQEETLARWENPEYRFELVRTSYGPVYKLTGVAKRVELQVSATNLEAKRLDDQEAPQREAARIATEEEVAKVKLEKARLLNKPKFRP